MEAVRQVRSLVFVLAALAAATARADMLALVDGRFVAGRPVERVEGGYKVKYENGEIFLPEAMVRDCFLEKDGEFEPRTDEEKEKFAKGLVPWGGTWVSRSYRDKKRQEALDRRKREIEQQKARQEWRNHVTVTTKKFVYKHTLPDDVFAELQDLFEAYYDFFRTTGGSVPPRSSASRRSTSITTRPTSTSAAARRTASSAGTTRSRRSCTSSTTATGTGSPSTSCSTRATTCSRT